MPPDRRLTAILAADVAGYSRLMGADEEGTHERLKAHLGELINPKIAEHHGRIVKNTGDGFLAEFASVVDAVRCAVEVQREMAERHAGTPAEKRIEFRAGINLGDVIAERDDIFGDGVNVAARLEALAEPGGICVSRVVRDQVRDKLDYSFEDLGEQQVKNIARPVRVYAVRREPTRALTAAGAVAIQSAAAPRLSIVVLPFTNHSNDPEQQYFADGITEDLTTDLSRIAGMLVISRNTAFTYRNKPVSATQMGRELNVRYLLEGSVRRSANRVRIGAQLIDTETSAHLWAERFDHYADDLFVMQDEITNRIAVALNLELIGAEAARPVNSSPDALDYILRGRAALSKPPSRDNYAEIINLFERALALDPKSIDAQSWLANMLAARAIEGWSDAANADIARAEALIGQALAVRSPRGSLPHYAKAQILRGKGQYREAIPEYEIAIALDRSCVYALHHLGQCKLFIGSIEEAIPPQELAIRISPRDPYIGNCFVGIGTVHLLQSRIKEAVFWLERACSANPGHPNAHALLASAYGTMGSTERAAAELAEARRLISDDRYSSLAGLRAVGYWGVPKVRALFETTLFAGLRKAGVPED